MDGFSHPSGSFGSEPLLAGGAYLFCSAGLQLAVHGARAGGGGKWGGG